MSDLKTEFIRRAAADLETICGKLDLIQDGILPANFFREISRKLHTIKGTAQTFNSPAAARLAHTLENLLAVAANESTFTEEKKNILTEGIAHLKNSLQNGDFQTPEDFNRKIIDFQNPPTIEIPQNLLPAGIITELSASEKAVSANAAAHGKDLYVLKICFPAAVFAETFKEFRQTLETTGEIIAVLPAASNGEPKICFRIVFAAKYLTENFIERTGAEIVFHASQKTPNDLPGVLAKITAHGKDLAAQLGKNCEFLIFAEQIELSAEKLKLIFDSLLHLIRNAVDHGIAAAGSIKITVKRDGNRLLIAFADNGKGIDGERLKKSAFDKNIISADENLTEQETNQLVFVHGLTTAGKVTEISGRGAGLNAVKTLIESSGGTISVNSAPGKGAIFMIDLPA